LGLFAPHYVGFCVEVVPRGMPNIEMKFTKVMGIDIETGANFDVDTEIFDDVEVDVNVIIYI